MSSVLDKKKENLRGGEFFEYENQFFSLQDIHRLLGFSTTPTDRELEAKIIMFMRKYNGYNSGSDNKRLYDFFDKLYDHLFYTDDDFDDNVVEGFVSSPNIGKTDISGGSVSANGSGADTGVSTSSAEDNENRGARNSGLATSRSVVQTVNPVSYSKDVLNPILKQTIQRVISIDSRYRNIGSSSSSTNRLATNFTIELSEPLRDVLSLKLYSYQIPFTWYTINKDYGSNFFIIKGNVPGLTDEYRIEITPGNYSATTLTQAINDAIKNVSTQYTDVSFGNTTLTYNTYTTVATFTIDIKKSFQEPQFYLDWVSWNSPYLGIDRDSSNNNILNIPQYLGFDYQTYNLNSIYSLRNVLPISSVSNTDDIRASIYYIRRGVDFSNNFFTVILYSSTKQQDGSVWSVNSFVDVSNNSDVILKKITLTLDLVEGGYSRNQLLAEVQSQIRACPYFLNAGSSLSRFDQTNGLNSFFQLSLAFDRKKFPFVESSKTVVIFPDEINNSMFFSNGYFPVWNGSTSCFCFDPSFVEMNDIIAEYPLFPANFVIQGKPYIEFSVNVPGYTNNKIQAVVQTSGTDGYTYDNYKTQINNAFSNNSVFINGLLNSNNTFGLLTVVNQKPFYFDSITSLPTFTFDFNYVQTTKDFKSIQFNNQTYVRSTSFHTPFLLKFVNGDNSGNDIPSGFTEFLYSSIYEFSFILKQSIPISSSYQFYIQKDVSLLKIVPSNTLYAPIFDIPFVSTATYNETGGYYQFSSFDIFIEDLLKSITSYNYSINDTSFPLKYSSIKKRIVTDISGISTFQVDFNIVVNKIITQQNCSVLFYDVNSQNNSIKYLTDNTGKYSSGAPYSSWGSYLNFTDGSYNLANILTSDTSIRGTKPIQGSTLITLNDTNRFFYFKPQPYADGLVTGVSGSYVNSYYNDIYVSLKKGQYSINSLFDALNIAFSNSDYLRGTFIHSIFRNGKFYCVLRININRSFFAKDYALDFYDLTSFVKCYLGSSVRNTTWDSTIGWILGFHEKTFYDLSSYTSYGTSYAIDISGELSVNTNLYSYFLISVDDFNQNRLNDGLVTITRSEHQVSLPLNSAIADITTDFSGNIGTSGSTLIAENNLTEKQIYSINQIIESRKNISKIYSQGPFVKDIFGFIPLKLPSTPGDLITEYGGTLQNQDRLYFGPVNIRRLQVQLINDKGTIMDLNGADWSFSFICEQLYQKKIT